MTGSAAMARAIRAYDLMVHRARLGGRREAFEDLARWAERKAPGSYDDEQVLLAVVEHCWGEADRITQDIRRLAAEAGITVDAHTEETS